MKRIIVYLDNFIFNLRKGKWYYFKSKEGIKMPTKMDWLVKVLKIDSVGSNVKIRFAPLTDFKSGTVFMSQPSQRCGEFDIRELRIESLRLTDFEVYELSSKEKKKIVEKMMINSL